MRKIILDLAVTLDGFIEGPNGEVDWCIMEDDMDFDGFLSSIDTIVYGRVSYDMWGNFRPDANASIMEKNMWDQIHSKEKLVFSNSRRTDENAIFINSDISEAMEKVKKQDGKNIWLYGGANLITTFINLNLIDTFQLSVHPTVLGSGKPLFMNMNKRLNLTLTQTRQFRSGVVQLIYTADKM